MLSKHHQKDKQINQKLDEEFVTLLTKIQAKYSLFNRHIQIRIQKWAEKLLQCDQTLQCRKTRNNYITLLYEMVTRGEVKGMFLKMPPENQIPSLLQPDYKRMLQQIKITPKMEHIRNGQICFSKLECPNGDNGSGINTPNGLSERTQQKIEEQNNVDNWESSQDLKKVKRKVYHQTEVINCRKGFDLIDKIAELIVKHEAKFKNDPQFLSIVQTLQEIMANKNLKNQENYNEESSAELRVEEGIGINMANLFQFGSPRGTTQMQYFKAALL